MRIGLVRHFKVAHESQQRWMSGEQFNMWVEQYDVSDIIPAEFVHEYDWDVCISSDLIRAADTASAIYPGDIVYSRKLREVRIAAVKQKGIKLHYSIWLALGHIFWYFHPSQPEDKTAASLRAREVIDWLECDYGSSNVLIVSHGAFMMLLAQELRSRGYSGQRILNPRNGGLYVYQQGD